MSGKIAGFYEADRESSNANRTRMIGFLGIMVGSIVIATYLPLFTLIGKPLAGPLEVFN